MEEAAGESVRGIFAARGEAAFRRLELAALRALRGEPASVVATGGGVVEGAEARRLLGRLGEVVWLQVAEEELLRRLARSRGRPSLTGRPVAIEARALLRRRRPLYREVADRVVRAGGRSPAALVRAIAGAAARPR